MPWTVAFALREWGWYLRSEVIWAKPNPMPESVRNRPSKSHEHLFLLAKHGSDYFWNSESREPATWTRPTGRWKPTGDRNLRSVWSIPTQPGKHGHIAAMPLDLARRCVSATSRPGDTVLDCFGGSGTTGQAALEQGREAVLVELDQATASKADQRLAAMWSLPIAEVDRAR